MTPKWVSGLVRARQFQEDQAKQNLATAERIATRAHARARYNEERLESLHYAEAEHNAPAFVASAVALQAAAATHAAAAQAAERADQETDQHRGELTNAAVSRRSAEELAERARVAEKARQDAIAQRAQDEIAAAVFRRHHGDTARAGAAGAHAAGVHAAGAGAAGAGAAGAGAAGAGAPEPQQESVMNAAADAVTPYPALSASLGHGATR